MELAELVLLVGIHRPVLLLYLRILPVCVPVLQLLLRGVPDDEPPHVLARHHPGAAAVLQAVVRCFFLSDGSVVVW